MRRGLLLAGLVAALSGSARAQVLWSAALSGTNVPSEPTLDTSFDTTFPTVYVGQGTKLYAFNALSGGAGASRWIYTFGGNVQNFPSPVPLSSGTKAVFVSAVNGLLYGINASTGANLWTPVDLRRASCLSGDQLIASPAVQLRQYSDDTFKAAHNDDLIMTITRHGCTDGSTTNRIYARNASTGTFAWTFNVAGTFSMDYGSEGCTIDYATNRLYCGTNMGVPGQSTLWAISTINGTLVWQKGNLGSIRTRPQPRGQYLYVGSYAGSLYVIDKDTGAVVWSTVVTTANITRNVWAEVRNGPVDYRDRVFVVDTLGWLYMYSWTGPSSSTTPLAKTNLGGLQVATLAAVMPDANITGAGTGALYVGASDGTVRQLGLDRQTDGTLWDEASFGGLGPGRMYDPTIGYNPSDAGALPYSVYLASTSKLTMLKGQWAVGLNIGAGSCGNNLVNQPCNMGDTPPDPCIFCGCSPLPCKWYAVPDVTPCEGPAGSCTCADDNLLADGNCPPPDIGCFGGQGCNRCCLGTCVGKFHVDHDPNNCGSCGVVCPSGTTCSSGKCIRAFSCDAATPADLNTTWQSTLTGATGIVYEQPGSTHCPMYAGTYVTGNSSFQSITPNGTGGWNWLQSQVTPAMHGIDVTGPVVGSDVATPALIATDDVDFLSTISTGSATSGSGPFTDSRFNQGIVGPALFQVGNDSLAYFANRNVNGDLWSQRLHCTVLMNCGWQTPVSESRFVSRVPGQRITAIAAGPRLGYGNTVYIAYGTWVSALDTASGIQYNVDLTQVFQPVGSGEHPVQAVLSMTVDPIYTDVYMEVKDTAGNQEILIMRADELTVYNLYDYNPTHGGAAPAFGASLGNEGRITASWPGHLIRLVPTIDGLPSFSEIPLFLPCQATGSDVACHSGSECCSGICTVAGTCQ